MKICQYCGTECQDSVVICPACGGNEFDGKCVNCGAILKNAKFCPECGVKAGARQKKCPSCGAKYYTDSCPDCGYTPPPVVRNYVRTQPQMSAQTVKKDYTWLWVLGWIFFFPIPLTVLTVRSKKLNKPLKIVLLALLWSFIFFVAFVDDSSYALAETDSGIPSVTESAGQWKADAGLPY